ncbi:MAG: hypothetical protein FJX76_13245 [Armatimonadetes bacterium]|nr:hypothetical protein [Armatimonadota bacterium]
MQVVLDDNVATIVMDEGKGNSMSPEMIRRLRSALAEAEASGARALIVTGSGSIFSAGLNLPVVSALEGEALRAFIIDFCETMFAFVASPLPVIAAVNGHAIAGGCVLAMACDYRLMVKDDFRIGLNEVDLGIRFPQPVLDLALHVLPRSAIAEVVLLGRLLNPEEALSVGLIHQLADPDLIQASARTVAREFAGKPPSAMRHTKADIHADLLARVRANLHASAEDFQKGFQSEETRARVREVVEQLAARR